MKFHNRKPIYLQLADYFFEQILKGRLNANEKIMSVRELAIKAEVTPNTAMRAYSYLQDLGIIYNKRGIGYYVSQDAYEKCKTIKKQEFIEKEVPVFFKELDLLNISFEELKKIYNNHKKQVI